MSLFGGKSLFGASKPEDKAEELANLVEATNTEAGITALGGVEAKPAASAPARKSVFDDDTDSEGSKTTSTVDPYLKKIFENDKDDDYLILANAEKIKPRSHNFTHTIGIAVSSGAFLGGLYAFGRNMSKRLFSEPAYRGEFITRVIRSSRNNAIRFGTFTTLMTGTGIFLENIEKYRINTDIDQTLPTEEEVMEMQLKGIQYQPPELRPVPEDRQRLITTVGIYLGGLAMAVPKAFDLSNKAKMAKSMADAQKDSGELEKWFLNQFGRSGSKVIGSSATASADLSRSLQYMAVGRVVGIIGFCFLIDQVWKSQADNVNRLVKRGSSSVNRVF